MNAELNVLLAGLRTIVGSSLNRVNDTVRMGQGISTKACSNCGAPFKPADWSAGKCSYCGAKIFGEHPSVASFGGRWEGRLVIDSEGTQYNYFTKDLGKAMGKPK